MLEEDTWHPSAWNSFLRKNWDRYPWSRGRGQKSEVKDLASDGDQSSVWLFAPVGARGLTTTISINDSNYISNS